MPKRSSSSAMQRVKSSAVNCLSEYLKAHHPETVQRIIATETADLSSLTEAEIEEIAKKAHSWRLGCSRLSEGWCFTMVKRNVHSSSWRRGFTGEFRMDLGFLPAANSSMT